MSPSTILRLTTRQILHPQTQTCRISKPCPKMRPTRAFTQTTRSLYPRKGSEDKDSINTEPTEYSKSGSDDASARQGEAAFDPGTTDPGREKEIAGEGQEGNPLEVSPANPEVSKPRGGQEGGAENAGENKPSGGQSSRKGGK